MENLTEELFESAHGSRGKPTDGPTNSIISIAENLEICMISATPFNTLVLRAEKARDIEVFNVSMRNMKIAPQSKKSTNLVVKLPAKFHNYLDVFTKAELDLLPEHQPYDNSQTLIKRKTLT